VVTGCQGVSPGLEDSLAAKRLKMNRLKEILRLSLERGLSQRKVARALRVGNGTVSECLGRARAAGVGWPLPEELEDEERLEAAVLGQAKASEPGGRDKPDVKWIHAEVRRVGVTLSPGDGSTLSILLLPHAGRAR
jgi:hypothetical protein